MFYVAQLYQGHWYVCPYTRTTQQGIRVPARYDRAWDTRAEAYEACRAAEAAVRAAGEPATGGRA
jgi:hypothetical protein